MNVIEYVGNLSKVPDDLKRKWFSVNFGGPTVSSLGSDIKVHLLEDRRRKSDNTRTDGRLESGPEGGPLQLSSRE